MEGTAIATSENTLAWLVIGRRMVLCLGAAMFFGGWASVFGADDGRVVVGSFTLAFFVPLRELRFVRDRAISVERII